MVECSILAKVLLLLPRCESCVLFTDVQVCWLLAVRDEQDQQILALIEECGCPSGREDQEPHHNEIGMITML